VFQVAIADHAPLRVAHLAISDPQKGIYLTDQKLSLLFARDESRGGFSFDIDGWKMSGHAGDDQLSASTGEYEFDLVLNEAKPPVLHNYTGLVNMGEAGESFYYSRTRLDLSGTISVENREAAITGQAWFDHQWGDFDPRHIGWDWFALQMSDGSDVMISLVRGENGQLVYRYGTFIGPDGNATHLAGDDLQVSPTGSWMSPVSGATYPSGWGISIPGWGIDVVLIPVIVASEFDATSTTRNYYWEGEVTIRGSHGGKGFVELSGYAESLWSTG
jgi:predicted secreted hydrolase